MISIPLAGAVLFDKPIHVTRRIDDPITGRAQTLDEYYFANRVVTVAGDVTVIADYDRSELTEIDRAHGTYSVTPFATIANARPHRPRRAPATTSAPPHVSRTGSERRAGRAVDIYAADDPDNALHAEVAVDQSVALSRDAFDVVVGAAHPNESGVAADVARMAARRSVGTGESYGLPLEQTMRFDAGGQTLVASNRVTRLGDELAPAELLTVPAGAKRVDSRIVRLAREAEQLDALPSKARP